MDFLTHLFLPTTVAYVVFRGVFQRPAACLLAPLGLLADFDKFLGWPGLLHSLVTLVPIAVGVLLVGYLVRDRTGYSTVAVCLLLSHLLLDVVDGGPVPLLSPFVATGVGLQYPVQVAFGQGPIGIGFEGPLVTLRTVAPRSGHNTYGFVNGTGVVSLLTFVTVVLGTRSGGGGDATLRSDPDRQTTGSGGPVTGSDGGGSDGSGGHGQ